MGNCTTRRSKYVVTINSSKASEISALKYSPLPYTHPLIRQKIYQKKDTNAPVLILMSNQLYLKRKNITNK